MMRRLNPNLAAQVTVLNESHWPISSAEKFPLTLSEQLVKCVSKFEEYYKSKTDKRKLRWLFNHGARLSLRWAFFLTSRWQAL
jgi:hypothetical protein